MTESPTFDCAPSPRVATARPGPSFSVVVPFYNEEENVGTMLAELRRTLDTLGAAYEVIAVDDGSTDGTTAALHAIAADWPQCELLAFAKNRGQAAALLSAFARAKGEVLVTLDGDGQNDPADIPRLIARLD